MKLLFDHNLSPRLVNRLSDLHPNNHLFNFQFDALKDSLVREYAFQNEFAIVTKDLDFSELSLFEDFPPKVI